MKLARKVFGLLAIMVMAASANAQFDIIDAKEAVKLVKDDKVIFVSTRKAEDYAKVHVTNAINLEIKALYQDGPVEGLLKSAADMAKVLGENGVDPAKTIIIYDNGRYVHAGHMYFALTYLGYPNVKILDGHLTGWRGARGPVTKTPTTKPAVTVTPKVNSSIMVDYNYTKSKVSNPGTIIVDVQSPAEFEQGHVPGAINMENKLFINEEASTLKSKEEMEKILAEHKIAKDKEVILYCASSARAGAIFLAMKGLGYKNLKVYEGGWNQWKTK